MPASVAQAILLFSVHQNVSLCEKNLFRTNPHIQISSLMWHVHGDVPQLYSILLFSAPLYSSLRYSTLLYSALLLSALLCSALLYSSDNGFQTTSLLQKHAKWTSDFRAYFSTSGTCQLDWMTSLLLLYLRNMQLDSMTSVLLLLEEHANWTRLLCYFSTWGTCIWT